MYDSSSPTVTLCFYSCLSSVGHLRFLSTSTRCMTLCWRTDLLKYLPILLHPGNKLQCFIIFCHVKLTAKTRESVNDAYCIIWNILPLTDQQDKCNCTSGSIYHTQDKHRACSFILAAESILNPIIQFPVFIFTSQWKHVHSILNYVS